MNGEFQDQKRSQLGSIAISDDQIMIFGGFLDTDLTNQCYIIDHNCQSIQKMKKPQRKRNNSSANESRERARDRSQNHAASGAEASGQEERNRNSQVRNSNSASNNDSAEPSRRNNPNREPNLEGNQELAQDQSNASNEKSVVMKKSKKFIKFKDFIIKLPNSTGLTGSKNLNILSSTDLANFVEPPRAEDGNASGNEGQQEQVDSWDHNAYGYNPFYRYKHIHPNQ